MIYKVHFIPHTFQNFPDPPSYAKPNSQYLTLDHQTKNSEMLLCHTARQRLQQINRWNTHTHTHSHSLSLTHSLTHLHKHKHTQKHILFHTRKKIHMYNNTYKLTPILSRSHFLSLSLSLSLSLALTFSLSRSHFLSLSLTHTHKQTIHQEMKVNLLYIVFFP